MTQEQWWAKKLLQENPEQRVLNIFAEKPHFVLNRVKEQTNVQAIQTFWQKIESGSLSS